MLSFLFILQPEQAVQGEEMLATAALFVKLDSAKNLPVSKWFLVGIVKGILNWNLCTMEKRCHFFPESSRKTWSTFLCHMKERAIFISWVSHGKKFNSFQFCICWYFYRVSLLIHTFLLLCRWQMLLVVQQVHSASLLLEMSLCRARYQSYS